MPDPQGRMTSVKEEKMLRCLLYYVIGHGSTSGSAKKIAQTLLKIRGEAYETSVESTEKAARQLDKVWQEVLAPKRT